MERFLARAKRPEPTQLSTSVSNVTCIESPAPKAKVVRKFQEAWRVGRPWLQYDGNLMFCNVCRSDPATYNAQKSSHLTKGKANFVRGCDNFRKSTVTDHENSTVHVKLHTAKQAKSDANTESQSVPLSQAARSLMALKAHQRGRLSILFRNAHGVAKNNRPISDYVWLCDLDEAKGVLGNKSTYRNEKACREFIRNIAQVTSDETKDLLSQSSYFSLSMDGSTDCGTVEQETLYVRSVKDGSITHRFMSIGSAKSASSTDLYEWLHSTIIRAGLDTRKLVSFATDGAANMTGKQNGVATQLKTQYPHVIHVHCLAHRLELAYKDAIKQCVSKQEKKLATLLVGIFYFYRRSPKQRSQLQLAFEVHGAGIMPTRVGGTRWVGYTLTAIEACLRSYSPLCDHLATASHSNPKAEGLFKLLTDADTVAYMLLLKVNHSYLNPICIELPVLCFAHC